MPQPYYMILTAIGAAKKANKEALGQTLTLTQFAAGDGGGVYVAPDQTTTDLVNEVFRADLNQIYQDPDNATYLVCEGIIPQNTGGWYVREVGIFDEDGDLIMVGAYPQTYKPTLAEGAARDLYIRAITEIGSSSSVELKIDPAIVLASRKYVDDNAANYVQQAIQAAGLTLDPGQADLLETAIQLLAPPNKNVIVDGNMQVWQEIPAAGLTGVVVNKKAELAQLRINSSGTWSIKKNDNGDDTYGMRFEVTAAETPVGSGYRAVIAFAVEGNDYFDLYQKDQVLSLKYRCNKAGTYGISLRNSEITRSYVAEFTSAGTGAQEEINIPISDIPVGGIWDLENGIGVYVSIALVAGTAYHDETGTWSTGNFLATTNQTNLADTIGNYFQVDSIKLERGLIATPNYREPIADTLAKVQRYYRTTLVTGDPGCVGIAVSTSKVAVNERFNPPMRASPTMALYSYLNTINKISAFDGTGDVGATVSAGFIAEDGFTMMVDSGSGLTSGASYYCDYVADARL